MSRKGAVQAHEGARASSRARWGHGRTSSRHGKPAGLYSSPHGAGRRFSRTKARRPSPPTSCRADDGIEYRHGAECVDEIPDAYKHIDQVMADAAELVEVEHELRQVPQRQGDLTCGTITAADGITTRTTTTSRCSAVPSAARTALDVGTGDGLLPARLRTKVAEVTGIDCDAEVIGRARRRLSRGRLDRR